MAALHSLRTVRWAAACALLCALSACGSDESGGEGGNADSSGGTSDAAVAADSDDSGDAAANDSGASGAGCTGNDDCSGGYCVAQSGGPAVCKGCVLDSHCPAGACVTGACVADASCTSDKGCLKLQAVCDKAAARCVECLVDTDCADGSCVGGRCGDNRVTCASSKDCAGVVGVCDVKAGTCVDCVGHEDCDAAQHCAGGGCHADVCTQGQTSCSADGKAVTTCSAAGDAQTETPCKAGESCADGVCKTGKPPACVAGAKLCVKQDVMVCKADGSGYTKSGTCSDDEACVEGACVTKVCTPSASVCKGNDVYTCNATGTSEAKVQTCSAGCAKGVCAGQACTPGATTCKGSDVYTCDSTGQQEAKTQTCAGGCKSGACVAQVCAPGSKSCQGNDVWVCKVDGSGSSKLTSCPSGTTCTKGECVSAPGCKPGDTQCSGDKLLTCDGAGLWIGASCDDGKACTQDTCDAQTKACSHAPVADGTACQGGKCAAGVCKVSCTPGTFVGAPVTLWGSKLLQVEAESTHVVVRAQNPANTSYSVAHGVSWSGAKLWSKQPSTAAKVVGPYATPTPDLGALLFYAEKATGSEKLYESRFMRVDGVGKVLSDAAIPTNSAQEILSGPTGAVRLSNGDIAAVIYSVIPAAKGLPTAGHYLARFNSAGKSPVWKYHVDGTTADLHALYRVVELGKGQLWTRVTVKKSNTYAYHLQKLDSDGKFTQSSAPFSVKTDSHPTLISATLSGKDVAYVQILSKNSPTKQYFIVRTAQGAWLTGDSLSPAAHGELTAYPNPVVTPNGVVFVLYRPLSSSNQFQVVLIRVSDTGKILKQVAMPPGDVWPWRVFPLANGNLRVLMRSNTNTSLIAREICSI